MSTRDLGPSDGVYLIGAPHQSQPGEDATPQTMGFKAFNLLRMANAGLNVPPALFLERSGARTRGRLKRCGELRLVVLSRSAGCV